MSGLGDALRGLAQQADETEKQRDVLVAGLKSTIAAQEAEIDRLRGRVAELEAAQPKPPARTLWGSSIWPLAGETNAQALARSERAIGPIEVVRHFSPGAPTWPSWAGGRVLHGSFKYAPARLAAGEYDAALRAWAAKAPDDRPTYATFQHEVDKKVDIDKLFPLAEFVAAWKRWAGVVRASGKPIRLTLTLTGWILRPEENGGRTWRRFFDPIGEHVDVLAWDPYAQDRLARITELYDRCAAASAQVGRPWAIAETGASTEFLTAPKRAEMLTGMARHLATMPSRPLYVCYFDAPVGGNSQGWPISTDPAAAKAWVAGRTTA